MGELRFKKELITFIITASIVILLIMTTIPPAAAVYLDAGTPSSTSVTRGNTITFSNVNLTIRGAERIPVEFLNFSIFRSSDDQYITHVKFLINGNETEDPLNKFTVQLITNISNIPYGQVMDTMNIYIPTIHSMDMVMDMEMEVIVT